MSKPQIQLTTVNLSQLIRDAQSEEDLNKLETLFYQLKARAQDKIQKERLAAKAAAEAQIAQAQEGLALVEFLTFGANYSDLMSTESRWMLPRRNQQGDVTISNPFTARDMHLAAKLAHKQLAQQADADDISMDDAFGTDEE